MIPVLELGRFLGRVEWSLQGVGSTGARVLLTVNLLDGDDNPIGSYRSVPEILAPAKSGVTEVRWDQPFPRSQEGATTVAIEYSVGVAEPVTTDIVFDLSAIPIGR